MCGIAGFLNNDPQKIDTRSVLGAMGRALRHRGPDSAGQYIDDSAALCHQRLSIVDLSKTGHQPMASPNGRFHIVFNGEIYNFLELREALQVDGVRFRGHSDTEVLIALYERYGKSCLEKLNGMFALAIWDSEAKTLFLARDRLGKKPLYYYQRNGLFAFGSEIKALLALPGIDRSLRPDAIKDYFFHQYVPDPKSIYAHIHKLPPAHWMIATTDRIEKMPWWNVSFAKSRDTNPDSLTDSLYSLLDDSVQKRMIADVPLGAFLSGGIDSSAMVGLMSKHSSKPITTCSIGFNSREHDEIDQARALAEHFETAHHEFTVDTDIEHSVTSLAPHFDEPFADPSFVPTYHVSRLARQKVTVALSGDGGDESFAGYQKYLTDRAECQLRGLLPKALRKHMCPAAVMLLSNLPGTPARRGTSLLRTLAVEPDEGFFRTNSFFERHLWDWLVVGEMREKTAEHDPATQTRTLYHEADSDEHLDKVLYTDLKSYLPGDILVKVDRMSMANSLETRAPLLDYRIVELAASMPAHLKLHGQKSKVILRQALAPLLPPDVFNRPKRGFDVPLATWLRRDLKSLAESLLFNSQGGLAELFDLTRLRRLWIEHQNGERDYSSELWSCLVYELWWQSAMVGAPVGSPLQSDATSSRL